MMVVVRGGGGYDDVLVTMMKAITNPLIEGKSKVELFEVVGVHKKPHSLHPPKLLLRHEDDVHLIMAVCNLNFCRKFIIFDMIQLF